ncbi:sulfite exporter TauE/SafE family protein [Paenibacillus sp. HN-1]|uniref:sulfite exporter TauE/SafE family protein n=1 Tax=Paenibacillus TaxID=44249 RepID=UPI001CAA194E|nr:MULTISPECIES: sulfite exporter TauE/SafE family protein [Paenibacillus]MBY9077429.1 sulfite exporter TauE/SafE family protein [Paenibacillus sp. CGMCC 1.18879]MBY9087462.1 sulfite exporter TauE/SafE family protein [Paenibacillus sinensis]
MNDKPRKMLLALLTGAPIGCLGGLIGLGGAEFRLPVLVGMFRYKTRQAVAFNLAVSLVTLLSSLAFRLPHASFKELADTLPVILSFIAGGLGGAYAGANYSKKMSERTLEKVILILLVSIGTLLVTEGFVPIVPGGIPMPLPAAVAAGVIFGILIGIISSMLGVAGGELIIPTLMLVYGVDIKTAGTASVLISLPTVVMGMLKHASHGAYSERKEWKELVLLMGIGSIIGTFAGGLLISYVSSRLLKFVLGAILILSALKMFTKALKTARSQEKRSTAL